MSDEVITWRHLRPCVIKADRRERHGDGYWQDTELQGLTWDAQAAGYEVVGDPVIQWLPWHRYVDDETGTETYGPKILDEQSVDAWQLLIEIPVRRVPPPPLEVDHDWREVVLRILRADSHEDLARNQLTESEWADVADEVGEGE